MSEKTENHHTTKDLLLNLGNINFPEMTDAEFDRQLQTVLQVGYSSASTMSFEDAVDKMLKGSASSGQSYVTLRRYFRQAKSTVSDVSDFKKQTDSSDLRAHGRNLLFRTLTTLAVGLSIMTVYAIAHWLEIPMPLMKLPLPV